METKKYRALVIRESEDKKFTSAIEELSTENLPAGDVLVRVLYRLISRTCFRLRAIEALQKSIRTRRA